MLELSADSSVDRLVAVSRKTLKTKPLIIHYLDLRILLTR